MSELTKKTASEVMAFHESRGHGRVKARWWSVLKKFVAKNGRFPPRALFVATIRPMYDGLPSKKRRRSLNNLGNSGWKRIINPKMQ